MSSADIHPTAIIGDNLQIGENVRIGPYCVIGSECQLGDDVKLHSHVVLGDHVSIGKNSEIFPAAVLGMPPQDTGYKGEATSLRIGNNTVIREQVTMHRGTSSGRGETLVGDNGFFMANVHIAHDCIVGDHALFANRASLGGHAVVGNHCYLGGICFVHQNCEVGDRAIIGGLAMVTGDVIPFGRAIGNHAVLKGMNWVGLKRAGFSNGSIKDLKAAYDGLFMCGGVFEEKLNAISQQYAHSEQVKDVVRFIRKKRSRPLCLPNEQA